MRLGTAIERLIDNYRYASDKELIQDKVAWALYYTWKEADDHKTEPSSSEIPNNCETCKHYKLTCDLFSEICKYEPKDEPQTDWEKSASKAVLTARCLNCHNAKACKENNWQGCRFEPIKDEPQTERIRKCIDCRLVSECRYTNPDSVICERFWQKERSE